MTDLHFFAEAIAQGFKHFWPDAPEAWRDRFIASLDATLAHDASRLAREIIEGTIRAVLASATDVQARDHVARSVQDKYGAPAFQSSAIWRALTAEQPT